MKTDKPKTELTAEQKIQIVFNSQEIQAALKLLRAVFDDIGLKTHIEYEVEFKEKDFFTLTFKRKEQQQKGGLDKDMLWELFAKWQIDGAYTKEAIEEICQLSLPEKSGGMSDEESVLYAKSWVNCVSESAAQPTIEDLRKWKKSMLISSPTKPVEPNEEVERLRKLYEKCNKSNKMLSWTIKQMEAREITPETLAEALGTSNSWPLTDVLQRLITAAEILLHNKSYDGHDYEEIEQSVRRAKETIPLIHKYLKEKLSGKVMAKESKTTKK